MMRDALQFRESVSQCACDRSDHEGESGGQKNVFETEDVTQSGCNQEEC